MYVSVTDFRVHRARHAPGALRAALRNFKGVKRRFTRTGEWNGVNIIDDYAHHPVEIAAVLIELIAGFGDKWSAVG